MDYEPPYAISPVDRTGLIVIVETLFMSWMIIVSLIRLYMRLAINGPVQLDDLMVFIGSALAVVHVGVIMDAVDHGLGQPHEKHSPSSLQHAGEGLYAANLVFIAGYGAAKLSVCLLLKRLGRQTWYLWCSKALVGVVALWTVASFLAVALSCHPKYSLKSSDISQHCSNLGTAWKAITAFDVIIEVLTFVVSIILVWGVQMRWKEKGMVIFAFGTRTPLIILIILRQTYLNRSLYHPDTSLHISSAVIATAVLFHTSIMVATVPCLKPFLVSFNTGWGQGVTNSNGEPTYFTPTGQTGSTNQSRVYTSRADDDEVDLTAPRSSQDSHNSRKLIIHETREWTVEEEFEMHPMKDRIQI
ncbi:hypothetical protein N7456_005926 [Penicillium angulare]|uniref:Rhodopsin domain-containing protein n=1 Tax=Penicillium angulare TaxID=116970 RepID=A0A9W9FZE9_9EURO|nr:hypothetical protein N7456_005926 [Penicillium angulare]